jgi:DNA-binding GntR family transcriptional regulator
METGKAQGGSLATVEAHNGIIVALERGDRIGFQYLMDGHLKQGLAYIEVDEQPPPPLRS